MLRGEIPPVLGSWETLEAIDRAADELTRGTRGGMPWKEGEGEWFIVNVRGKEGPSLRAAQKRVMSGRRNECVPNSQEGVAGAGGWERPFKQPLP